jgi:hypothetical protein
LRSLNVSEKLELSIASSLCKLIKDAIRVICTYLCTQPCMLVYFRADIPYDRCRMSPALCPRPSSSSSFAWARSSELRRSRHSAPAQGWPKHRQNHNLSWFLFLSLVWLHPLSSPLPMFWPLLRYKNAATPAKPMIAAGTSRTPSCKSGSRRETS